MGFGSGRSVEISKRVFSGTLFDLGYSQASLVFPGMEDFLHPEFLFVNSKKLIRILANLLKLEN